MHKAVVFLSLLAKCQASDPASAFQGPASAGFARGASAMMRERKEVPDSLKEMAVKLNPVVGYWDPIGLGTQEFWGQSNEATVGFLRHAEIKHGRVAMAAFVGYCVQSNGIYFPWKLTGTIPFKDIAAAGSPADQWDALPPTSKAQILLFIGLLEFWSESSGVLENDGLKHYMRGGVPGKFPSFDLMPHPVPFNLYDPFGYNKGKSREVLDKKLLAEINNGRAAMLGIMGLLSAAKGLIVPGLDALPHPTYAGEIMAPFSASDKILPYVEAMLKVEPLKQAAALNR
jgi:hypothetical protein